RTVLKSLMLLTLICAVTTLLQAQTLLQADPRLEKAYDSEYLEHLRQNSPSTLEILNFELDNSWFIAGPEIAAKADGMEYLYYRDPVSGEKTDVRVEDTNIEEINIAEYFFDRKYDSYVFYKIGDSGMIIGFYSSLETAKRFNISKNQ
ncbi:MAG: hypothetical protein PHH30_07540, partial [Bacteroidales bacterium]|nr:hypothetical protein [Bacteroidales bacterium]